MFWGFLVRKFDDLCRPVQCLSFQRSKFQDPHSRNLSSACAAGFQACGRTSSGSLCLRDNLPCPVNDLKYSENDDNNPTIGGTFSSRLL